MLSSFIISLYEIKNAMSSFSQLIKDLENNFKPDLSPTGLDFNLPNVTIKLYDTIEDACLENMNHEW